MHDSIATADQQSADVTVTVNELLRGRCLVSKKVKICQIPMKNIKLPPFTNKSSGVIISATGGLTKASCHKGVCVLAEIRVPSRF